MSLYKLILHIIHFFSLQFQDTYNWRKNKPNFFKTNIRSRRSFAQKLLSLKSRLLLGKLQISLRVNTNATNLINILNYDVCGCQMCTLYSANVCRMKVTRRSLFNLAIYTLYIYYNKDVRVSNKSCRFNVSSVSVSITFLKHKSCKTVVMNIP